MPKVKRKRALTDEEKAERERMRRLLELEGDEIEEEVDEPDEDDLGDEIVVIRGKAASSLLRSLGYRPDEPESDDDEGDEGDEENGEEPETPVKKKSKEKEEESDEVPDEKPKEDPKPPSAHRYFRGKQA